MRITAQYAIKGPHQKTPGLHKPKYDTEGFKGSPQLVPKYAYRQEPLEKPTKINKKTVDRKKKNLCQKLFQRRLTTGLVTHSKRNLTQPKRWKKSAEQAHSWPSD